MSLEIELMSMIENNSVELREALRKEQVLKNLSNIGIFPKVLELHAPSERSKKTAGLGTTLCGRNGTLHSEITCKKCLHKLKL